jgi:hypothetical protein
MKNTQFFFKNIRNHSFYYKNDMLMALKIFLNDIFWAKFECKPLNLKIFLKNSLKMFQIKQSFLNNQVGGCRSFDWEHTLKPLFLSC